LACGVASLSRKTCSATIRALSPALLGRNKEIQQAKGKRSLVSLASKRSQEWGSSQEWGNKVKPCSREWPDKLASRDNKGR